MTTPKRVLSGMRPTGDLHIGNYFGAIQQFIELQRHHDCYYFVADLHALTEVDGKTDIDRLSVEVVKNYLACGIDPDRVTLYRQSDVPEISEITVLLGNITRIAQLRRCTTYRGKNDNAVIDYLTQKKGMNKGEATKIVKDDESEDNHLSSAELRQLGDQFSYGLLGYPVLMAADILAVRGELVPVGADQKQHVEFARDFARSFNHIFAEEALTIPEITNASTLTVPGVDGSTKMGKSDGNTIALLEEENSLHRKIARMPTQAESGGPMEQGTRNLYNLIELSCPTTVADEFLRRYTAKEKFFGDAKKQLAEGLMQLLVPIQEQYAKLSDDDVRDVLAQGAHKVGPIASEALKAMQSAMGL